MNVLKTPAILSDHLLVNVAYSVHHRLQSAYTGVMQARKVLTRRQNAARLQALFRPRSFILCAPNASNRPARLGPEGTRAFLPRWKMERGSFYIWRQLSHDNVLRFYGVSREVMKHASLCLISAAPTNSWNTNRTMIASEWCACCEP